MSHHCFTVNDNNKSNGSILRAGRWYWHAGNFTAVMSVGWSFFNRALCWFEASLTLRDKDGGDVLFTLIVPFIAHLTLAIGVPRKLLTTVAENRVTGIRLGYVGAWVDVRLHYNEHLIACGMLDYYREKLGDNGALYTARQLTPGWYWRWMPRLFDRLLGKVEIQRIQIDGCSTFTFEFDGRTLSGSWKLERIMHKRPRWPWPWRQWKTGTISVQDPPMYAGKGENPWDCGDDCTYSISSPECLTLRDAVGVYMHHVVDQRLRRELARAK